ncbi:DNA alkylation repair protein [Roseibacillus ishigakijimensis]|uniref:DNA alkylation repair protein n=1 Tax=Roseibacillus ishigakijimensis TaxID=454146 RepID=A0A934VLZ1_9BACT|nr:DNA alkylation repair protein [Roseibacillus ishigakijimensis]
MKLPEALRRLEELGDDKVKAQNAKRGAGDNQFGVRRGDLRKLAKEITPDPALAHALWLTGNLDAQLLAVLLWKPKDLSAPQLDELVRQLVFADGADWFGNYLVKKHRGKEALRLQ